jgi:hypothetical protein
MASEQPDNPFPGVNPYVESEGYWDDFHGTLIPCLREVIVDALPPRYDARVEERMLVLFPDAKEQRRPDVVVTERTNIGPASRPAVATASAGTPTVLEMLPFDVREERETWIDIRDLTDESVVTSIEVLSPSNKDARGSEAFHLKRNNLLMGGVNLVDLDLLLHGERLEFRQALPPAHYYAFVTRASRRPRAAEVYAWTVRDPLPPIPIPLREPDPDVTIDLGEAYRLAFERGRYPRRLRYRAPVPLLADADRAWAANCARGDAPQ